MAARGRPSAKEKEKEEAEALGPDRVPENQKREVYERVRRAVEAKAGACTSHKVGSSPWDKHEQKVLEDGLRYYPHDRHSNMLIYIRIAASLPKKSVRDVAHHLRHMQDEHKAKVEAAAGMNPAKRHHPDPAAAAVMAAMHEHQMAAMFAANAVAGMAAMHTMPGMAQGLSGPGGPGPHLKDEKVEARVCTLLQENMVVIGNIRENIVMGRFLDNHSLMINFDKNVKEVTALLATLPFAEMQKLPVQINPYFITGSLPPGMVQQQPGSPTHHLQGPPGAPPIPVGGIGNQGNLNGNGHGNGNGNGHIDQPMVAAQPLVAAPVAGGGAPPQQAPQPPLPQPQPPSSSSSFVAPPSITPAAQPLPPQLVPEVSEVVTAGKAVVSTAAPAIPGAPANATALAAVDAAAAGGPGRTAVEGFPVEVVVVAGGGNGGNGGGGEKGFGVEPPGTTPAGA